MESPSICIARQTVRCSTGRSFPCPRPWPYADSENDASITRTASAMRERGKHDRVCVKTTLLLSCYEECPASDRARASQMEGAEAAVAGSSIQWQRYHSRNKRPPRYTPADARDF